jgi:hypothetical protein
VELFRGRCDMQSLRVLSLASCCSACLRKNTLGVYAKQTNKVCTGFTFTGGTCFFKSCTKAESRERLEVYRRAAESPSPQRALDNEELAQPGATCAYLSIATH